MQRCCKTIYFPLLPLQPEFEKKKINLNISHFSFYQSQRDGVFHNQVLRCAGRTSCPQGLSGERGEYQVLRGLSCYYHHTVMAFCPILPRMHPPPTRQTGWHGEGLSADGIFHGLNSWSEIFVVELGDVDSVSALKPSFSAGNLQSQRCKTKMVNLEGFFFF